MLKRSHTCDFTSVFSILCLTITLSACTGTDSTANSDEPGADAGDIGFAFNDGGTGLNDGQFVSDDEAVDLCDEFCEEIEDDCGGLNFDGGSCLSSCLEQTAEDQAWLAQYACLADRCDVSCISSTPPELPENCVDACANIATCGFAEELEIAQDEGLCQVQCMGFNPEDADEEAVFECVVEAFASCDRETAQRCFAPSIDELCDNLCTETDSCVFGSQSECLNYCTGLGDHGLVYGVAVCLDQSDCDSASRCADLPSRPSAACEAGCDALTDLCSDSDFEQEFEDYSACIGECTAIETLIDGADTSKIATCIAEQTTCPDERGGNDDDRDGQDESGSNSEYSGDSDDRDDRDDSERDGEALRLLVQCSVSPSERCAEVCDQLSPCIDDQDVSECPANCAELEVFEPDRFEQFDICLVSAGERCSDLFACLPDGPMDTINRCEDYCDALDSCGYLDDPDQCRNDCVSDLDSGDLTRLANLSCVDFAQNSGRDRCYTIEVCTDSISTETYCESHCEESVGTCQQWDSVGAGSAEDACVYACSGTVTAAGRRGQFDFARCTVDELDDFCQASEISRCL